MSASLSDASEKQISPLLVLANASSAEKRIAAVTAPPVAVKLEKKDGDDIETHASSEIETIVVNATLRDVVITASSINFIAKAPKNGKNLPKTTMLKSIKGIPVANILIDPLRKFITKYASLKKEEDRRRQSVISLSINVLTSKKVNSSWTTTATYLILS